MQSITSTLLSIQSVDTLTTIILLLVLTCGILAFSIGLMWYRFECFKDAVQEHIKQIEDMIS